MLYLDMICLLGVTVDAAACGARCALNSKRYVQQKSPLPLIAALSPSQGFQGCTVKRGGLGELNTWIAIVVTKVIVYETLDYHLDNY